jgi:hypothetical protein
MSKFNGERFYLACPFAEKDNCKSLGGRWDQDARKWYVPNDVDRNKFKKWWVNTSSANVEEVFFG